MLFTCSPVMTRPTSPDCVSTWLVTAAIEMVSLMSPTSSWKSTERRDVEQAVAALDRREAGQRGAQFVRTGRQADEHEAAGVVGDARLRESGLFAGGGDGGARQRAARGIGDASRELRDVGLGQNV